MSRFLLVVVTVLFTFGGLSGQGPNTATLTLQMVKDANSNNAPNWGDTIRFEVKSPEPWDQIQVVCTQGEKNKDKTVYGDVWWIGSPSPQEFLLRSDLWPSGAAQCEAVVEQFVKLKKRTLGSLAFSVAG